MSITSLKVLKKYAIHVGCFLTYGVQDGEEERGAGADLVELDVRVERDVLVQRVLLHLRDQVPES